MDKHHVAGKPNSRTTISVPVNDHRAQLTVDQYEWPKRTRENPDRSPLIAASACIRGFIDTVSYLTERLLYWIAEMLELFDQLLAKEFGSKWWLHSKFQRLTTEVFGGKQ